MKTKRKEEKQYGDDGALPWNSCVYRKRRDIEGVRVRVASKVSAWVKGDTVNHPNKLGPAKMDGNKEKTPNKGGAEERKKKNEAEAEAEVEMTTETRGMDPMAKMVINQATVNPDGRAQKPHDVLAFSRSLHNVDSSLE
ncbi:hypothetical protein V6N13_045957 [Hibiscus sabdariffa]|uniref:Uncharacterized protein n=1 Tax=Hibiscus sabdariffa TaxID=183260 RepID=A0ABR2A0L2_9ROSI